MTETIYRIVVDENSYAYTQDDYNKYVADMTDHNTRYPQWQHKIYSPAELQKVHLDGLKDVPQRRYTTPANAQRYITLLKKHHPYLEFYIERAELDWKKI